MAIKHDLKPQINIWQKIITILLKHYLKWTGAFNWLCSPWNSYCCELTVLNLKHAASTSSVVH